MCGVLGHLAPVHRCACLVHCFACAVYWATWLRFTGVPAWFVLLRLRCPGPLGSYSLVCPLGALYCLRCWFFPVPRPPYVCTCVRCPGQLGFCSPVCPLGVLCCMCGVLGHSAPVHRCVCVVCCVASEVSWGTWLLFTGVSAWCVVLRVWCPGPLCSFSPVCPLGALFACAVSWATGLLFTGVPAPCVALRVRCPGPLGCCSPLCPLGALCCVCGVLCHLAPVHRCARSVHCFACAVSWASWPLFSGVPARCVALRVLRPRPLGSCSPVCPPGLLCCPGALGSYSPVCPLGALFCVCGVLAHFAPFHRCARSVRCVLVRCPGPPGSCSPVCPLGALCCVCGVLCHLAPVHRCARSVHCFACALSWATWLLFTGVPTRCVDLLLRCPGPLGSCSPVCPLRALLCVCGVLGHLAPVQRCARSVRCVACAVSWAT